MHTASKEAAVFRGALLVDAGLAALWPTEEDWLLLEFVLGQDVLSLFENTKLCPVECRDSLQRFIDKVFNLENMWTGVLGFKWSKSWQYDFLTFQLFFQFITLIRQTGVEGNHRQEVANRVLFGFHPNDSFPLKHHLQTQDWQEYQVVHDSTVNQAVRLSIISRDSGPTTTSATITFEQLRQLRSISEAVTESRDLHIVNDWSHIIGEVIARYTSQVNFELVTEAFFVHEQGVRPSSKPTVEDDKHIKGQDELQRLITQVLFSTQPGKEAVVRHGLNNQHTVTEQGWLNCCLRQGGWIGYQTTPHPAVSCPNLLESFLYHRRESAALQFVHSTINRPF